MVEQTGKHTFFGRTATLLQSVDSLGSLQRVLMRVVTVLLVRPGLAAPKVIPKVRCTSVTAGELGETAKQVLLIVLITYCWVALCPPVWVI